MDGHYCGLRRKAIVGSHRYSRLRPSTFAALQALQLHNFWTKWHTAFIKGSFWSSDFKIFNAAKMKQISRRRIELLMCEVKDCAKSIEVAGNHGPSADQSSTIKQHAVEILQHTHTPSHMINIEIDHFVALNERNPTRWKWKKNFVSGALSYSSAKLKALQKAAKQCLFVHEFWCIQIFNRL